MPIVSKYIMRLYKLFVRLADNCKPDGMGLQGKGKRLNQDKSVKVGSKQSILQ